jgi:predicted transcriptional regulator
MNDAEMFNIENYDKREAKNKKLSHTKRIIEEAQDLMDYYYLKKEEFIKFTNNYLNKKNELGRYYADLQQLVNKYNNKRFDVEYDNENKEFDLNNELEEKVNVLLAKARSSKIKEDEAYHILNNIWLLNKSLELNKTYLDALRYDDDIDEEMRLVITKIDFMKELLSKQKKWFSKVVNIVKAFNNIDSTSTYKSIYDDDFIDKFTQFVNNKYEVINKISEFKLCEYLNDFAGNNEFDIESNIKKCSGEHGLKVWKRVKL